VSIEHPLVFAVAEFETQSVVALFTQYPAMHVAGLFGTAFEVPASHLHAEFPVGQGVQVIALPD
jgi:hypothetical protein